MSVQGRYYDGINAVAHVARTARDGGVLTVEADGATHVWALKDLTRDQHGGEVRLSPRGSDARLILSDADWALLAPDKASVAALNAGGGPVLIGWLVGAAVVTTLIVFVGLPMASGPLARATPLDYEARMGTNYDAQLGAIFPACDDAAGQAALADLGDRIAAQSDSPFDIRVRAVHAPMINAFALPGGHVLVTDDLIREAETPDELAGVIAHEVAHVERRHVMQAVWRDLGAGMLLDLVVGGGTGAGQQAILLAGQTSQLSYGRAAEIEADARGIAYLNAAGLSSEGVASFFSRMAGQQAGADQAGEGVTEFLSSHPNTRRRIGQARALERPGAAALDAAAWRTVQGTCASGESEGGGQPWFDRMPVDGPGGANPASSHQPDQMRQDRQAGGRP